MNKHYQSSAAVADKPRIYLRPPVSYYGGKQTMLRHILPLVPSHQKYCEPFLGGGAVFWAKQPAAVEVINDLDGFVSNFYFVMKSDFETLKSLIDATVYGRESHERAAAVRQMQDYFSPVQRAWAFFVLANSGMFAALDTPCIAPGQNSKRGNAFYGKVKLIDSSYSERFKNVFVEQRDANYVLRKNDSTETFFFVDPPYFQANMGHYAGYTHDDFERLLETLATLKGKFMLTSYPSDLLQSWVVKENWRMIELELPLAAGSKGKRKTEVLTLNY